MHVVTAVIMNIRVTRWRLRISLVLINHYRLHNVLRRAKAFSCPIMFAGTHSCTCHQRVAVMHTCAACNGTHISANPKKWGDESNQLTQWTYQMPLIFIITYCFFRWFQTLLPLTRWMLHTAYCNVIVKPQFNIVIGLTPY